MTITEKTTSADSFSGIWPPDDDVTISRHDINVKFFWRCFVSLVKFSYWSKFHVNIITGFGIITIFFYVGLTRNLDIANTPVWVLPNIWRLGRVMETKFDTSVTNGMLLNDAKFQGYSVYSFWVIKRKPTGRGGWERKCFRKELKLFQIFIIIINSKSTWGNLL